MQVSLLQCYVSALMADPLALIMSVVILWSGYLLFGLEPSPAEDA
ncbi:MAG: hypothetical protein ACRBC3_10700 [Burkholderiaceae bacterium]